jgi:hypothetical protein
MIFQEKDNFLVLIQRVLDDYFKLLFELSRSTVSEIGQSYNV